MSELVGVLTVEDVQRAIPSKKGTVTQELVNIINRSATEPEFQGESLMQTMVTYQNVMQKNAVSMKEYISAIRFCAYLISMDDNYTEAYKRVFWDREFVQARKDLPTDHVQYKELTSAASRYRRSRVVVDILTLSQVPLDLIFAGHRMRAIGVLATVMETGRFDRDRIAAAKELLAATMPKDNKITIDIGPSQASAMVSLQEQIAAMALNQKLLLEAGVDLRDVQRTGIKLNVEEADIEYS